MNIGKCFAFLYVSTKVSRALAFVFKFSCGSFGSVIGARGVEPSAKARRQGRTLSKMPNGFLIVVKSGFGV